MSNSGVTRCFVLFFFAVTVGCHAVAGRLLRDVLWILKQYVILHGDSNRLAMLHVCQ